MAEDEIMELLWQNGQVVMQSQRPAKRPSALGFSDEMIPVDRREVKDPSSCHHHPHNHQQSNLFTQEDEMASWLLNDTLYDFCSDLLYSPASPCVNTTTTVTAAATASAIRAHHASDQRQLVPAPRQTILPLKEMENFGHQSQLSRFGEDHSEPSHSNFAANELTVVDSSDTPAGRPQSRVSDAVRLEASRCTIEGGSLAAPATSPGCRGGGVETVTCEVTVTSSPGGSSASAEPPRHKHQRPPPPPHDRKRKAIEADDAYCQSEDVDLESADGKKQSRGSTSMRRSRAAKVHNLSERRRRDRINEKMRALQELIPHCSKADKASMLDEAIEYLKSLQLQVQMMSMGCSMVPMMFPEVPQYMPHMGMGIGIGMGMEMSMNRPMMSLPHSLASSPLPAPGSTLHLGPRFHMPSFHTQHVNTSRGGATPSHQSSPMQSSLVMQNSRPPQIPNFVNPYRHLLGFHNLQMQPQRLYQNQNQATQQGTSKPSTNKGAENLQSPKSG